MIPLTMSVAGKVSLTLLVSEMMMVYTRKLMEQPDFSDRISRRHRLLRDPVRWHTSPVP